MKQLIYYIKLTDGTEIISITRNDAVEKINNYYKTENYYEPITLSILDRLIINGKTTSYIEIATKTPINQYYKKEVDLFILNDKKTRTEDAMKKAINRYVNKLYYGNHIVRSEIEDVNKNNEILLLKNETDNEILKDMLKTDNEIIDELKTDDLINDELKTDNLTNDELKTISIAESDVEPINNIKTETEIENDILNNENIEVIKKEVEPIKQTEDKVETDIITNESSYDLKKEIEPIIEAKQEEEVENEMLKRLTDYLMGTNDYDATFGVNDIKLYYENNKKEVEDLFANEEIKMLVSDEKPNQRKDRFIKKRIKTLRNKWNKNNRQNKTLKRTQI